jgi:hypothetical protein
VTGKVHVATQLDGADKNNQRQQFWRETDGFDLVESEDVAWRLV